MLERDYILHDIPVLCVTSTNIHAEKLWPCTPTHAPLPFPSTLHRTNTTHKDPCFTTLDYRKNSCSRSDSLRSSYTISDRPSSLLMAEYSDFHPPFLQASALVQRMRAKVSTPSAHFNPFLHYPSSTCCSRAHDARIFSLPFTTPSFRVEKSSSLVTSCTS